MRLENIKALSGGELIQVIAWGQQEKARAGRHKRETITKIKKLAGSVRVSVAIGGTKDGPRKRKDTI